MSLSRVAAFAALVALSADVEGQSVRVGMRGGFTMAKQVDDFGPSSTLPGVTAGASAVIEFTTWLGVEGNLLYTQKGWRRSAAWVGLDYVELPTLLRLAIPLTDVDAAADLGLQPFMLLGPSYSILVKCNSRYGNSNNPETQRILDRYGRSLSRQFPVDCSQYAHPHSDFGLIFGAGITLRRARQHITVEVRQSHGLADLRTGPRPQDCGRCTLTNSVTSVLLGAIVRM